MKLILGSLLAFSLFTTFFAAQTPRACGQFAFPMISITNATTTNVSGITYAKLSCTFPPCYNLLGSNVVRSGNNLSVTLGLCKPTNYICLCDFEPLSCPGNWEADETLVLGALEPGDYNLIVYSPTKEYFGSLFAYAGQLSFTVSNTPPSTPMLSLSPTNSGLMKLDVNGIASATYVLESSTDLTNWTSLWTNNGAPFWATFSLTNDHCYLRTEIRPSP